MIVRLLQRTYILGAAVVKSNYSVNGQWRLAEKGALMANDQEH